MTAASTALQHKFKTDAERPSMRAQNYMAADTLATYARHQIDVFTPIRFDGLTDTGTIPINDNLSHAIGQQLGERFMELGYTFGHDVQKVPGYKSRPFAILKGNYKVDRNDVHVDLIMVEEGSNRLIAKTDYDIPMKREVREIGQLEDQSFLNLLTLDN